MAMSGEFLGTFYNSINKGKWITIPAVFKRKFSPQAQQTVIITIGPRETIAIFPLDNWNDKIENLRTGSEKDIQLMVNLRSFASAEQKMESNGRIKLSDELIEIAGIDGKAVIKGEGNFISIWNPENYNKFRQQRLTEHREIFDSLDYQK